MKYLKYSLCALLLIMVGVACEDNPSKFPIDIKELQKPENTGGFLRIVSIEQGAWDLLNIQDAAFIFTIEADDAENGGQLESVDFYVAFSDNQDQTVGDLPEVGPIMNIPASDFSVNQESGLPRTTVNIPAPDAMDALDLQESDLGDFDTFDFRWVLHLTNGKSFSVDNTGLNVSGGAFFNSPFQRAVLVGKLVPQDQFVGSYTMTRTSGSGAFGGIFEDDSDGQEQLEVELEVDPNNGINGRTFVAPYLPQFGFGDQTWNMILVRIEGGPNETVWPLQGTGLSCGGPPLELGPPSDPPGTGTFVVGSDDSFTLNITANVNAACDAPSSQVSYTLTKN